MSQRREQGGWLIRNPDNTFRFEPFPATYATSPCAIALPMPLPIPPGAVAMVHTHPFRNGERMTSCDWQETPYGTFPVTYRNTTSMDDDQVLRRLQTTGAPELIGIMIDADKIVAYNAGPTESSFQRCGY